MSITLFPFEKGEEIRTNVSGGDAMVQVLEGTGRFTVGGEAHLHSGGESIVMPEGAQALLEAVTRDYTATVSAIRDYLCAAGPETPYPPIF